MTTIDETPPLEEIDHGTPRWPPTESATVTIDGREVTVPAGTSVMRAAAEAGISVPKLCATDSLEAFGSCRLCLVEVEGGKGTPASCTTPCSDGMVVSTRTEQVRDLRRDVMELYLSDHPIDCDGCARGQLRDAAPGPARSACAEVRYGLDGANHLHETTDHSNPYFDYDPAACIVCSRCVRACDETQGTFALTVQGRGFDSRITAGGTDFLYSECVSCGACVQACPTDALTETLDRPARDADPLGRHDVRVLRRRLLVQGRGAGRGRRHARRADDAVEGRRRQRGPLVRQGPLRLRVRHPRGPADAPDGARHHRRRVAAWCRGRRPSRGVADGFRAIQDEHGVGSIGGISSSRCTNEEVYVVQKMVRAAFGNNNIDTCARVCHSPTGYGLNHAFGTSAGTQDFKSVEECRRHARHRRQPHRRPPGVRVPDEAPAARGREGHRRRPAPHRPRAQPARRGRLPPAACSPGTNVAFVNAMAHVIVTEGLHDADVRRLARPRVPTGTSSSSRARALAGGHRSRDRCPGRGPAGRGAAVRGGAELRRSTTGSASPSTARARRW